MLKTGRSIHHPLDLFLAKDDWQSLWSLRVVERIRWEGSLQRVDKKEAHSGHALLDRLAR